MTETSHPARSFAGIGAILVHVEPDPAAHDRLHAAVDLARRSGARLIGLGAEMMSSGPVAAPYAGVGAGEWIAAMTEQIDTNLKTAREAFEAAAADIPHEWRAARDIPARALAGAARAADLLVASALPDRDYFRTADPGELVMRAGRPVLLAPDAAQPLQGRAVVIGWKDTRESRRAVLDALPFLRAAETVTVVGVHEHDGGEAATAQVADVVAYLQAHAVPAQARIAEAEDADVVVHLRNIAQETGADLIVTGAYGQSRLMEWVFGGVTRRLMGSPPCWLFMSH